MRERATESGRKGRDRYFWLGQSTLHRQHKISADAQALGEYLESHPACSSDVFEIQCPRKGSPSSKDHRGWPVPLPPPNSRHFSCRGLSACLKMEINDLETD